MSKLNSLFKAPEGIKVVCCQGFVKEKDDLPNHIWSCRIFFCSF